MAEKTEIITLNKDDVKTLRETGGRVQFTRDHTWAEGNKTYAWAHACRKGFKPTKVKVMLGEKKTETQEETKDQAVAA